MVNFIGLEKDFSGLKYGTSNTFCHKLNIQGQEEKELPEYILGTVRLNRVRLDSAVLI